MFAGTSPPAVDEADADQPVRGSTVSPPAGPPPVTVVRPVSRMSREEEPTETVWSPVAVVQEPAQYWKLRASRVSSTCLVWPGSRATFWKPRRFFGGSPLDAGWPT